MPSDKLQQAITLIKAGDKKGGQNILVDIVNADPNNESAWLWLSSVVSQDKRTFCLEKVLSINPNNTQAKQYLEKLKFNEQVQPNSIIPPQSPTANISEEAKSRQRSLTILFLIIGFGGNCLNWTVAHTMGWFMSKLAFITASVAVMGLYFLLFPKKFYDHYEGKSNVLLFAILFLSLLIGWLNYYAFEHGLY